MKKIVIFIVLLVLPLIGRAGEGFDKQLFEAYQREDMSVWKEYLESLQPSAISSQTLLYEYGYCGYIVAEAKKNTKDGSTMYEGKEEEAKRYVAQFKKHVEAAKESLPAGHYEMYMSAVYVYELRLHIAIRPVKAMNLAKEATQLAPQDPLVLAYYGTSLYYAPRPFGSKKEALRYFKQAATLFEGDEWQYCWVRKATEMYIREIER